MKVFEDGIAKRLTWATDDKDDAHKAESIFIELTKQGWLAIKRDGEDKRILEFKPEYGELLFVPLIEGGK